MRKLIIGVMATLLGLPVLPATAATYGEALCQRSDIECYRVKRGDNWQKLFPNSYQADVVKRLNRTNMALHPGQTLAIPRNLGYLTLMDISPMPRKIDGQGRKILVANLSKLAWGAYDESGYLVHWGPLSGGKSYCPDVGRGCRSPQGEFSMIRKEGADCVSTKFPVNLGEPRAKMPYCMFFHGGFAFHGSAQVPGYHASHGCIRIFTEDARWLNQEFIDLPGRGNSPTKVVVQPYGGSVAET